MRSQRFFDPLYGRIPVDDLASSLVFSPEFQRLRYVRLCNINSLYITGASEPKRFEHCLGVYHLATVWSDARRLTRRDADIARAAALLHDLQTGPFGHSFQYVLEDNAFEQRFEHDNLSSAVDRRFLQRAQANASFSGATFISSEVLGEIADPVFAAIRGEGDFGPIISGTLDLDNLDNVVRLAFHVGLCEENDRSLPLRLAELLEVRGNGLAAPEQAYPLILRWFNLRRELYRFLLLDRGEFSAKAMLTLAVEAAVNAKLLGPDSWKLTDEELLRELEVSSVGEHQVIGQIVRRVRLGQLFECVGVWCSLDTTHYKRLSGAESKREIELKIEHAAVNIGAQRFRCCIHFILDNRKTCRATRYWDLTLNEERVVGYDSQLLLVGLFITNSRVQGMVPQDRVRYARAAHAILAGVGLGTLDEVENPLCDDSYSEGFNF